MMMNPQPDETDLGVYQCVDISTLFKIRQYGADAVAIHFCSGDYDLPMNREEAQRMITALQRWLDTGGFYAPTPDLWQQIDDIAAAIPEEELSKLPGSKDFDSGS